MSDRRLVLVTAGVGLFVAFVVVVVLIASASAVIVTPPSGGPSPVTVCWNVFGDPIPQPNTTCPPGWSDHDPTGGAGVGVSDRATGIADGTYCYHLPEGYYERCAVSPTTTTLPVAAVSAVVLTPGFTG